jgi:hypothetical protein
MPQGDEEAGEVEEALKHREDAVVADLDAAEVLQPGIGALDFPALSIAAKLAFVLESAIADVLSVGNNQFRSTLFEARSQSIGAIAPICNDSAQMGAWASAPNAWNLYLLERTLCEAAFGNLRGRKLHSDRNALGVDHHHTLRTFPAACFADCRAPFFAVMNVASRKASSQSSNRRWSSIDNSFCQAASQIPSSSHIRSRRQQVEPSGYCSGRSRHLAPVRRTHNIPSTQDRFDDHGRPRPSLRRFGSGNKGANTLHCTSSNRTSRFFCLMAEDKQTTCPKRKYLF